MSLFIRPEYLNSAPTDANCRKMAKIAGMVFQGSVILVDAEVSGLGQLRTSLDAHRTAKLDLHAPVSVTLAAEKSLFSWTLPRVSRLRLKAKTRA